MSKNGDNRDHSRRHLRDRSKQKEGHFLRTFLLQRGKKNRITGKTCLWNRVFTCDVNYKGSYSLTKHIIWQTQNQWNWECRIFYRGGEREYMRTIIQFTTLQLSGLSLMLIWWKFHPNTLALWWGICLHSSFTSVHLQSKRPSHLSLQCSSVCSLLPPL